MRIETFKKEMKDPKPGGRLKQLAMEMTVSVVGTTIPEAKLAFNGTGEAAIEAEVSEKPAGGRHRQRLEGSHQGRHQAGGRSGRPQAVATPKSAPVNESRKKKKGFVAFPGPSPAPTLLLAFGSAPDAAD